MQQLAPFGVVKHGADVVVDFCGTMRALSDYRLRVI
jgi:hypothetical protein